MSCLENVALENVVWHQIGEAPNWGMLPGTKLGGGMLPGTKLGGHQIGRTKLGGLFVKVTQS